MSQVLQTQHKERCNDHKQENQVQKQTPIVERVGVVEPLVQVYRENSIVE